jgi:hypothetical protein
LVYTNNFKWFQDIIVKNRDRAGFSVPAHGLYLTERIIIILRNSLYSGGMFFSEFAKQERL